ncbi:amidohydrolase family protein [Burkholderia sp. Ac-20353]|uniref:amidohydrolase family protein n=1 Tax=Burkholderia sp. Ac-20353 TaxID=2703894 RepID=UPI00197B3FEF
MSQTITGKDPATGRSLLLHLEGGCIASIRPGPKDELAWLTPGLIDLQVNGYAGHDLNGDVLAPETVIALAAQLSRHGVTTFVPTLITSPEEKIIAKLRAIAVARARDPLTAYMIPYAHIEGPALAESDGPRGAHPREHVRAPDMAEFDRWQRACGGLVGMVTLSPHWDGTRMYVEHLVARGVHVCIGHTDATPEQVVTAVDAGASMSTHLGNGAHTSLHRHRNCLWTQLAEDRLHASFIVDGHHLPADALNVMLRSKSIQRSVLVSDVTSMGGLPPGNHLSSIGGLVSLSPDGRLQLAGTDYLAGSATLLGTCVARAVRLARLSLADAIAMATVNPGRFVHGRGVMRVGARADVIRFHWQPGADSIQIDGAWVAGGDVMDRRDKAMPPVSLTAG